MQKIYKNKLLLALAFFSLSLATVMALSSTNALAATRTWDGEGADNNFSTDANWSADTAPVDDDIIVFPSSVDSDTTDGDDRALNNDIAGLSVAGIQFTGTYVTDDTDYYDITGSDLTITGDVSNANGSSKLNLNTTLGADISSNLSYLVPSSRTLTIGTHTLTVTGTTQISGSIIGSANSNIVGESLLYVYGAQAGFSGTITQNSSRLYVSGCSFLDAADIVVANSARLEFFCSTGGAIAASITLNGDGADPYVQDSGNYQGTFYYPALEVTSSTSQANTITIGSLVLNADSTYGSYMAADSTVTVQAITKNGHSFTRVPGSAGKLIVAGTEVASDYTTYIDSWDGSSSFSQDAIDKEKYLVTGNQPAGAYTILKGSILGGTGTVGTIDVDAGGTLAPGMSPGCLNSGNVTFVEGGIYAAELGGTTVCTQYDQQRVTGTLTLGNATLSTFLWNGYKPAAGSTYTIISNDGADAVSGTFKNLPEGATYTQDGYVIQVSYVGGDGNDVVLTVKSIPKTPNTGFAPLTNNPLSTLAVTAGAATMIALIAVRRKKLASATSRR